MQAFRRQGLKPRGRGGPAAVKPQRRGVLKVAPSRAAGADDAGTDLQQLEQIGVDFAAAIAEPARANEQPADARRLHVVSPSIARQMRSRTRRISRSVCMPAGVTA